MKNNIFKNFIIIFLFVFLPTKSNSTEQFNFDVTNVEILENGNLFKGKNKGIITSESGIVIKADTFEYNKIQNILKAKGNVVVEDKIQNYTKSADSITKTTKT